MIKFVLAPAIALLATTPLITSALEEPPYRTIEQQGDFEIRSYPELIVAETIVDGDFKEVGNEGFRRLFGYISGGNTARETAAGLEAESLKIKMTAPVTQTPMGEQWRVTFLMPSNYALGDLPRPVDGRIKLTEESPLLAAVIKYSGTWSERRYRDKRTALENYIDSRGLKITGSPVWARYDPPFMPWFLRRNEIIIPVQY